MNRRTARGFSLLELGVVAILLSILMAIFLERLTFYQEAAERAQFETTLQLYKTSLQIRLAELILERREGEVRTLEVENPTHWLPARPANYAGNYPNQPQPGHWYFDGTTRELVYIANAGDRLAVTERDGVKQLRFRVKVIYQPVNMAGGQVQGIGGIVLSPSVSYTWIVGAT